MLAINDPGEIYKEDAIKKLAENKKILNPAVGKHTICDDHKLTPSPNRDVGAGYKEAPYSSTAMGHMVKARLAQAGVFTGQTTHGSRRGRMQHDYYEHARPLADQAGVFTGQTTHGSRRGRMQHDYYEHARPLADVMRRAQIRTEAVGLMYLNRHAHLPYVP
jgi:hypothetical protein